MQWAMGNFMKISLSINLLIDDDSNLEDTSDVNTIELSHGFESKEVASEEIKTDLPSFESNENVESEFPIKHEEREPSEVALTRILLYSVLV